MHQSMVISKLQEEKREIEIKFDDINQQNENNLKLIEKTKQITENYKNQIQALKT